MKLSECKFKKADLYNMSSSIELMDEFINNEYTFLILDTYSFSFVVSSEVYEYESICGDLTMTQLRREDWGSRTVRYFKNHKIYEKQFSKGDKPQNLTQSLKLPS